MNTSRQISNRNRQLNLTQDISSSFNPYIFSKHDRAFHHHVTEHPVHHSIIDSLSMTEYLVATKRSAQRSGEHRHRKEAWIAQKREPPKKSPVAPSVREGHATTPGFKVQPGRIAHTTRKGGMERVYTFHSDKSARNRRILLAQHLDLLALHPPSSFLESSILLRSTCSPPPGSHDRV